MGSGLTERASTKIYKSKYYHISQSMFMSCSLPSGHMPESIGGEILERIEPQEFLFFHMVEFLPIPQPRSNLVIFYISVGLWKIIVSNQKQIEEQTTVLCKYTIIKAILSSWSEVKVAQSCPTLWDPTDYTVHSILQARIQEWVAFPNARASSQSRDRTQVSRKCRQILSQLSHRGSPRILEWVAYPFSSGFSWPRNWTGSFALQVNIFRW